MVYIVYIDTFFKKQQHMVNIECHKTQMRGENNEYLRKNVPIYDKRPWCGGQDSEDHEVE